MEVDVLLHTFLESEVDGIDRDDVFTCKVLEASCEEGLREVEAGNPEGGGYSLADPLVEKCNAGLQIRHPRS